MMRKNTHLAVIVTFVLVAWPGGLSAQEKKTSPNPATFSTIAGNITDYQGKTVTMTLRLKVFDRVFEKISFYDTNNHDIEFSIDKYKISKRLKRELINLHNGMYYRVTFTVESLGPLGLLNGKLISFRPLVLERLP